MHVCQVYVGNEKRKKKKFKMRNHGNFYTEKYVRPLSKIYDTSPSKIYIFCIQYASDTLPYSEVEVAKVHAITNRLPMTVIANI